MPAPRPPLLARVGSPRWVASLAALTGVTALSVDMSLPAQPALARVFGVSGDRAQLTLSLFVAGFAFGQVLLGAISDAWGRRPVLLGGLVVFSLAGVACAASSTIGSLLACRLIQGAGAASGSVIARAMVRDTQPAAGAARMLSTMLSVLAVAPMIAPLIGGQLLAFLGWRAIFGALAAAGVTFTAMAALTLEETRPAALRHPLSLGRLVTSFGRFFRTPGTRLPTLLGCACFAGQFAYISDSPFVLIEGYGVAADRYGWYFASTALALMLGSMLGGRILAAGRAPRAMLVLGATTLGIGGALVALGARNPGLGVGALMAPMIVYFLGVGLTGPSATAVAMDPVPEIAGTASAAIGFSTMLSGAASGYLTTRLGGADPALLGTVVAGMGACAVILAVAAALTHARVRSH